MEYIDIPDSVLKSAFSKVPVQDTGPVQDQYSDLDIRAVLGLPDEQYVVGSPAGLLEEGNIDLLARPSVVNADGSVSTVRSMSVNIDGEEILIPTVSDDGTLLDDDEAVELYERTGRHLGKFKTPEQATKYAEQLHQQQAQLYDEGGV